MPNNFHQSLASLDLLPREIPIPILVKLNIYAIVKLGRVNKKLLPLTRDNYIWKEKLKLHFPYDFERIEFLEKEAEKSKLPFSWYTEFKKCYKNNYPKDPFIRKLILIGDGLCGI